MSDPQLTQQTVDLAVETRTQAGLLLRKLQIDRARSEKRCSEFGLRDPVKDLTGLSAIERAIVETKEAVTRMDELINDLGGIACHLNRHVRSTAQGNLYRVNEEREMASLVPIVQR